jgi:PAS domain S-box-containing protein
LATVFLDGGGAMGALIRTHDWAATPLGALDTWPVSLRAAVALMVRTRQPAHIAWGPGQISLYNDAYIPILGRKHPAGLGQPAAQLWSEIWDTLGPLNEAVLAGEAQWFEDMPFALAGRDRGLSWFSFSSTPLVDDAGAIAGIYCVATETTERILSDPDAAGERLALNEERLRLALEVAEIGQWHVDADTGYMFWPPRVKAMFGISPTVPVTLQDYYDGVHPDDRAATLAAYQAAFDPQRRPVYDVEYRTVGKEDGVIRWVAAKGRGLFDAEGRCYRMIGTAIDVTARKAAERRLRDLNETLEQEVAERTAERNRIWQVSRDMLMVADAEGRWLSVNPAWTRVLGWSRTELVGRTSEWLEHPDDQAKTRAEIGKLADGEATLAFENRFRAKDGAYRTLSWTAAPFEGLFYCSARDVTEEKGREQALVQAEEALRQSQKLEAVGQLTGGVAHDFNNLLTIIRSSVDFLRRPGLAEERKARYLNAVSDTVDRAAKLTGQLLAFARRQTLKPETVDVGMRLRGVAELLDTVTGARIAVRTELPDHPCCVCVDVSQFETALVNMAVNARDAMDGEGTLILRLDCGVPLPSIRGHAGAPGPFAAVSLDDTGSGIPADVVARIFEPFFTTKEVGKGTGLGLSQVFGFAKQSGGDVAVMSEPGRGTTFTMYLPEAAMEHVARADDSEADVLEPGGAGQRVLVVEDNIEVGRFATQILQDLGYKTTWAANAEEALDRLGPEGDGFDVVFSDVVMPGMGGIALAKRLRERLPDLPVVLASGYSHTLAEEGVHGFTVLQKPYSADQVSAALRQAVKGRRKGEPRRAARGSRKP